tara:strand:- start:223 stop:486 length:264 start_codon:yes stop_codon:yes gene_type:complete
MGDVVEFAKPEYFGYSDIGGDFPSVSLKSDHFEICVDNKAKSKCLIVFSGRSIEVDRKELAQMLWASCTFIDSEEIQRIDTLIGMHP